MATVVVDDDGPGIPSEEREAVLLPRIRGSAATAAGNGLGLHIAATTMAEQAGTLRVTRHSGRGTRVIFALPVASAQPHRIAPLHRPLAS
jgi:signal transduction histidine kinase